MQQGKGKSLRASLTLLSHQVNAFEVGEGLRALYDVAFLLSHDCTPNTSHSDDERRVLSLRASVAIPRGRPITLSYAYTIQVRPGPALRPRLVTSRLRLNRLFRCLPQGTLKRREHLKESKFFDCCCPRCSDPTELGTLCSALMCPRCGRPAVLPSDPLQAEAPWRCTAQGASACPFEMPANQVKEMLDK